MHTKKQPKISGPRETIEPVFDALLNAIEECRAKPAYDYQRIIICHAAVPGLGARVASRTGGAWMGPPGLAVGKGRPMVVVIENADDCGVKFLESVVRHVNLRRGVVVLMVSHAGYERWHARWSEMAGRIRRRTHLRIDSESEPLCAGLYCWTAR